MPPEAPPARGVESSAPLPVAFADLFDNFGTADLRYSAAACDLSGREVAITGFLSRSHSAHAAMSLVDQPGVCPDCAPVPTSVIALPGVQPLPHTGGELYVRVVGRLGYGFRIDGGLASMLRIEQATLHTVPGSS